VPHLEPPGLDDTDHRRQMWPDALHDLPLTVLPMTRRSHPGGRHPRRESTRLLAHLRVQAATLRSPAHVERLERLASLVPNPTLDQLELLRQRFAPEIPETAVLHVATDVAAQARQSA
jgi:hypothetical protein